MGRGCHSCLVMLGIISQNLNFLLLMLLFKSNCYLSTGLSCFQVALHFWGTGSGALPVVSFLFLRDLCMQLGSDCFDDCIKGMYKAYVLNSQHVTAAKLQHIQFLGNCFIELLSVNLAAAYQHAFLFIRQLATSLRETISSKKMVYFSSLFRMQHAFTHIFSYYSVQLFIIPDL